MVKKELDSSIGDVRLREVIEDDLAIFFEQQLDVAANRMAAFTVKTPSDRDAFMRRWARILHEEATLIRTILFDGDVAGHISRYEDEEFARPEISYWLGKNYWGKGIATRALTAFLSIVEVRPIYSRAAKDNIGSFRVLQKCGFTIIDEDKGFSNARGVEVEEYVLRRE